MNLEIYSESAIDRIRSCQPSGVCESIPAFYSREIAVNNCRMTNTWAPNSDVGIQILYVGESFPKSEEFAYNINSPVGWFARDVIQADLRDRIGLDDFNGPIDKNDFLFKIQRNGVVAIDCCKCAVNYKALGRTLRNDIVCACCGKHTIRILTGIIERYNPQIRFAFPSRKGNPVLKHLRGKYGERVEDIRA